MNKIHYRTILFLLSILSAPLFPSFGQTLNLDSLETELAKYPHIDTVRVNLLNCLAYQYNEKDIKKTAFYAHQAKNLAIRLNYTRGKAEALRSIGLTHFKGDRKLALSYYEQALSLAEQEKDQETICSCLLGIGHINKDQGYIQKSDSSYARALRIASKLKNKTTYIKMLYSTARSLSKKGKYPEAVEMLQQIIDLATGTKDQYILPKTYNTLAAIFDIQGNSPQALEYTLAALRLYEQSGNQQAIYTNSLNMADLHAKQQDYKASLASINRALRIAKERNDLNMTLGCLYNFGNIYKQMKRPEAMHYYQEALQIARTRNVRLVAQQLINIAEIHTEQKKYGEAEKSLNEAVELATKLKNKSVQSQALLALANLYYIQKQYASALKYADRTLQIAIEIKYLEMEGNCYKLLANIHEASGDYRSAYLNHVKFKQTNDSLFNAQDVRKTAVLETTYKYEKERQKSELEKVNQQLQITNQYYIIVFLTAFTLLVLALSYQYYISSKLKKKALRQEIEKANLELEYKQKEIVSASLKLVQSSESDAYCMKILRDIGTKNEEETDNNVEKLISYYKNKSLYSNWEEFEILFLNVHADFYSILNERFPKLTLNERKLCVFLKLNMTNKDIAQITFQSEEALKKARMRLRKKLELDRDESLTKFMQDL